MLIQFQTNFNSPFQIYDIIHIYIKIKKNAQKSPGLDKAFLPSFITIVPYLLPSTSEDASYMYYKIKALNTMTAQYNLNVHEALYLYILLNYNHSFMCIRK